MSRITWKTPGFLALCAGLAGNPATLGWLDSAAEAQVATRITPPAKHGQAVKAPKAQTAEFPPVWIGVRLTPLPEPVAAQLQREGLMIANVAENSPADKAGLDRYDVLVSLGGQAVQSMDDVRAALDGAAGKEIEAVVLREGAEKHLKLTPTDERPDGPVKFRYDEPAAPGAQPFANFYGGRLKVDPQGQWLVEPLGPMTGFDQMWQQLGNGPGLGPDLFPDDAFVFNLDNDVDIDATFSVTEVHNGATLSVQRGRDGTVTVERTDAAGNRTESRYDNMDQLKDQDKDAYELVQRRFGMRITPRVVTPGSPQDLIDAQRDFEQRLEQQLEAARQRTRAMMDQMKTRNSAAASNDGQTELRLDVQRQSDGTFRIRVQRGDEVETHEFKSLKEMKAKAPKLFDELRDALNEISQVTGQALIAA